MGLEAVRYLTDRSAVAVFSATRPHRRASSGSDGFWLATDKSEHDDNGHPDLRQPWYIEIGRRMVSRRLGTKRMPAVAMGAARGARGLQGALTKGRSSSGRDGLSAQVAASAVRIKAGRDFEPVFLIMVARWLSTVRWLMPRSAAMFLLGWPASTRSKIWR
jgi:hypothetical protein